MLGPYGAAPRGSRRLIFVSDPSSVAMRFLPDPTTERDLRDWVDHVADAGVDTLVQEVYTQGWTVYWRAEGYDYDARPQHRRFLPLLDAGVQPLGILIDQARRRDLSFIAGFRMNDNHGHISKQQGVGAGGGFLTGNPRWQLREAPPGDYYRLSTPLDFTVPEVRDFILTVMTEVPRRFDVDGLEMCFRDHRYFPPDTGRDRQPLMTELVERIRAMLDDRGRRAGKRILLGARVYQTLEECHSQGLDVPTWIARGLIDYACPADVMYADANAPYAEFAALARAADCKLYPSILPWSSFRARRRLGQLPITQANRRALAHTFYGAGADGISIYNHFEVIRPGAASPPFYPHALHDLAELRDPDLVRRGRRHYLFDPVWGGHTGFGLDRTSTGAVKADRIVLRRDTPGAGGAYTFRLYEDLADARAAALLFRGFNLTRADRIDVALNGATIPPHTIRRRDDEVRIDVRAIPDRASAAAAAAAAGIRPPVPLAPPEPEPPFATCYFPLAAPPLARGENRLEVRLIAPDPAAHQDIVIDELEVFVTPRL